MVNVRAPAQIQNLRPKKQGTTIFLAVVVLSIFLAVAVLLFVASSPLSAGALLLLGSGLVGLGGLARRRMKK